MGGLTNSEAHHVHFSVPLSVCQLLCVVVLLHKEEEEAREDGKDEIHTDICEWHGAQVLFQVSSTSFVVNLRVLVSFLLWGSARASRHTLFFALVVLPRFFVSRVSATCRATRGVPSTVLLPYM